MYLLLPCGDDLLISAIDVVHAFKIKHKITELSLLHFPVIKNYNFRAVAWEFVWGGQEFCQLYKIFPRNFTKPHPTPAGYGPELGLATTCFQTRGNEMTPT